MKIVFEVSAAEAAEFGVQLGNLIEVDATFKAAVFQLAKDILSKEQPAQVETPAQVKQSASISATATAAVEAAPIEAPGLVLVPNGTAELKAEAAAVLAIKQALESVGTQVDLCIHFTASGDTFQTGHAEGGKLAFSKGKKQSGAFISEYHLIVANAEALASVIEGGINAALELYNRKELEIGEGPGFSELAGKLTMALPRAVQFLKAYQSQIEAGVFVFTEYVESIHGGDYTRELPLAPAATAPTAPIQKIQPSESKSSETASSVKAPFDFSSLS